jgi:molybdate transport system ATP-binding protein
MTGFEVGVEVRFGSHFELKAEFAGRERVTALFGPSGSGKTTILGCIAGLVAPDSGRIVLADRVLFDSAKRVNVPARSRRIGCVFQDHLLFPHLTVEENLRFGMPARAAVSFAAVVDVLELGGLLTFDPSRLSGGQKQRVALGRALLSGPELLLMDEPLASLDASLKVRILDYLEAVIKEFRIPTLFVSHSQAEVRRLAQWAVILDAGKVKAEGPPESVMGQPTALEFHNGLGPINLLRLDAVEPRNGELVGRSSDLEIRLPLSWKVERTPAFVEFEPREVMLAEPDVAGVSARNRFAGVVAKIVPFADRVFVAVDVGAMIWAEVTASAVAELQLSVGRPIVCLVKTQSLRLA